MGNNNNTIVIWDHHNIPPNDQLILLWRGYAEKDLKISLLKYLEDNSDQLRSEYFNYIYNLGQLRINGDRIVKHLKIEPGFSIWWMSLIAEKSSAKSKAPIDCLRMLAVNHYLINNDINYVELISSNKFLVKSLNQLCSSLGITFVWKNKNLFTNYLNIKILRSKLTYFLKVPIFLVHKIISNWSLRNINNVKWFNGNKAVFLFSYFFALDQELSKKGRFYSRQWGLLPELLQTNGKRLNWIHHFYRSSSIPDTKTGIKLLRKFNYNAKNEGNHSFLDSFLTLDIIGKVITTWVRLVLKICPINKKLNYQMTETNKGWLWPLLYDDWKSSVYGITAIQNIIWFHLFDKAISQIPKHKIGLYLCENQGWERALIYIWKKYDHGDLIAVQHSTVRYWDLRYFDDPKVWNSGITLAQPIADKIAINGLAAWGLYENENQVMNRMIKVEAIRYLHLNKFKPSNVKSDNIAISGMKKILLVGDIQKNTTNSMLELLNSISLFLSDGWELTLKPHPANQIKVENYPDLNIRLTKKPLEKLLANFKIAISSVCTSASIEVFLSGLNVITILDDDDFNSSALRGIQGATFVSTKEELKDALISWHIKPYIIEKNTFFWTDPDLKKWKNALNLN